MNDLQVDFFTFDLLQRTDQRLERALRITFQNNAQNFFPVGRLKQALQRGALRHSQFIGAFREQTFLT